MHEPSAREQDIPMTTDDDGGARGGGYPSRGGRGERAAWFRDSEGNLIGMGQPI